MSVDPEMLMAYADGELGPLDAKRVERVLAGNPALAAQVARHRNLRAALSTHFAPVAEEPVPDRLATMLKSNVVERPWPKISPALPGWTRWGGAIAASLAIGVLIGHGWSGDDVVRTNDGQLYAAGSLATALDNQLAANGEAVRVPVTFRDATGSYCRVFTSRIADGIACHNAQGWALRQTRPGSTGGKTEYAQAGSTDQALLGAAQEMMVGDPLDASAEVRARDAGWRQ